jgi:hypothetical protein
VLFPSPSRSLPVLPRSLPESRPPTHSLRARMEQRWRTRCFAPGQGRAATTPGCVTAAALAVLATAGAHSSIRPGLVFTAT